MVVNIGLGRAKISSEYFLKSIFLGTSAKPFYYVIVLLYITLLTPMIAKVLRNKKICVAVLLSLGCIELAIYYMQLFMRVDMFSRIIKYTPLWAGFYIMGMMHRNNMIRMPVKHSKLLLLVAYILELVETFFMVNLSNARPMAYSQMRISGFFYAFCLLSALLDTNIDKAYNNLHIYGDCSYGIFYVHCLILIAVDSLLTRIALSYIVYVVVEFVFCSLLSMLIVFTARRIIHNKDLLGYIGLS